jgi:hypothetical protein
MHCVNLWRVGESRIERHALETERHFAVLVQTDHGNIHSLLADFDKMGIGALDLRGFVRRLLGAVRRHDPVEFLKSPGEVFGLIRLGVNQ